MSIDRWGEGIIDDVFEVRVLGKLNEFGLFYCSEQIEFIEFNDTISFDKGGKDRITLPNIHINFLTSFEYPDYLSLISRFKYVNIITIQ